MEIILLKVVLCRRCGRTFYVCQSCWRGQAYCCDSCRHHSRREAHRLAQQRYRRTAKGREAHRQSERKRRMQVAEKTMADTSSTPVTVHDRLLQGHPFIVPCCHFCSGKGVVVEHFPRRGYGRRCSGVNFILFWHFGGAHGRKKTTCKHSYQEDRWKLRLDRPPFSEMRLFYQSLP